MKRALFVFVVFILGGITLTAGSKIDGKWSGKMETPNGDFELTFTFQVVNGDSLTGTVGSQMGEMEFINGKVNGDEFSFDVSFNDMTIHHSCKLLEDGTISMKVPGMQGDEMELILTRVEEDNPKADSTKEKEN